jgi:predicted ATPase
MLAAVREPELVPAAIAADLSLPETFGRSPAEAVVEALRGRRMLLVLDNMEQVVEAAPLIVQVLAEADGVRVLVTSREVLHLTGEHVFDVPPLPVGDQRDAARCRGSDAVELFFDRARAAGAPPEASDERTRLVAEICRRLEGLPLAIELAAARMRTLSPEVILRRLDHRLSLLTGGPRDAAARQRTLRATIQWSYDLLDDDQRQLFAALAIFSGPCFLDAVEAVGGVGAPTADVLEGLTSLADKSMIRTGRPVDGAPSFSMLETVREFAIEALETSETRDVVARLHAEYFEGMARTSVMGLHNGPGARSWDRFALEAANIHAAFSWFRDNGHPDRITAMGEGMWPIWWGWSVFDEGMGWMQTALADPHLSAAGRAVAEFVRGSLAFGHGDPVTSVQALEEARRLHRELGDDVRAATDVILLGIAGSVGDPATAEPLEREAVDVLRRHGEPWKLAFALFALGQVLVVLGRTEDAVPLLEETVQLQHSEEAGKPLGPYPLMGYAMVNLGWARLALDDAEGAGRSFRQALSAAGQADQQVRARAMEGVAAVAVHLGDPRTGAVLFGGAEAVRGAIGIGVWLTDQSTHADTQSTLRSALGSSAYDSAFAAGMRTPPDELHRLACAPISPPAPATGGTTEDAARASG